MTTAIMIKPTHTNEQCYQHNLYFRSWVPLWLARFVVRKMMYQTCVYTGAGEQP